jgi:hypothetical protein
MSVCLRARPVGGEPGVRHVLGCFTAQRREGSSAPFIRALSESGSRCALESIGLNKLLGGAEPGRPGRVEVAANADAVPRRHRVEPSNFAECRPRYVAHRDLKLSRNGKVGWFSFTSGC